VMVQTIIGLARNFRLEVISEGVETEDQLAFLKYHGCEMHQGYLFGKPVPLGEFEELLEERQGCCADISHIKLRQFVASQKLDRVDIG